MVSFSSSQLVHFLQLYHYTKFKLENLPSPLVYRGRAWLFLFWRSKIGNAHYLSGEYDRPLTRTQLLRNRKTKITGPTRAATRDGVHGRPLLGPGSTKDNSNVNLVSSRATGDIRSCCFAI